MTTRNKESVRNASLSLGMVATLQAILSSGSVSKAALMLGVSQPSVSHALRSLREYYNDELFVRIGNTLQPTPRALGLAPMASRLLGEFELIARRSDVFNPREAQRQFLVCMSADAEFLALPRIVSTLAEQAPACTVRGRRVPMSQLKIALESGEVDLAIGNLESVDSQLRRQQIGKYQGVCMVSASGPWSSRPPTLDEFSNARHVIVDRMDDQSDPLDSRIEKVGVHRHIVLEVANHFVAAKLVIDAGMICCLPHHTARALASLFPINWHPLPFESERVPVCAVWHERFHKDAGLIWLRNLVRQTIERLF